MCKIPFKSVLHQGVSQFFGCIKYILQLKWPFFGQIFEVSIFYGSLSGSRHPLSPMTDIEQGRELRAMEVN